MRCIIYCELFFFNNSIASILICCLNALNAALHSHNAFDVVYICFVSEYGPANVSLCWLLVDKEFCGAGNKTIAST